MANRISWLAFGVLLLGAVGTLIARGQSLISYPLTSVILAVLILVAITVGIVTAALRRRARKSR